MNVPGDSRRVRLNNVIALIGQEIKLLDMLLEEFTNILLSSSAKIRIGSRPPALQIREMCQEFQRIEGILLKAQEYTDIE